MEVPSPNPGGTGSTAFNWLNAVAALSSSRAWAVGASATSPTTTGHTLVEHWNGTAWKVHPPPAAPGRNYVLAAYMASGT